MYCIHVTNPAGFSATTFAAPFGDTELSLFAFNGIGVAFNDDAPTGGTVSSRLTGSFIAGVGTHHLAVSRFRRAATAAGGAIWALNPTNLERSPDGPGAPGPLSGWTLPGSEGGFYGIQLTGATFCTGSTDAPPGTGTAGARLAVQPNPFTVSATISYSMPEEGPARLSVLDIGGRLVRTLVHEQRSRGEHAVRWDGRDERGSRVPVGIYLVQMETGAPPQRALYKIARLK